MNTESFQSDSEARIEASNRRFNTEELENKFMRKLEAIAVDKGCEPLPLGFLSLLDQPDDATEFWNDIADFCKHVPTNKGFDIDQAIRYEFKYRHGLF